MTTLLIPPTIRPTGGSQGAARGRRVRVRVVAHADRLKRESADHRHGDVRRVSRAVAELATGVVSPTIRGAAERDSAGVVRRQADIAEAECAGHGGRCGHGRRRLADAELPAGIQPPAIRLSRCREPAGVVPPCFKNCKDDVRDDRRGRRNPLADGGRIPELPFDVPPQQ